jgi:hypothetical protein
MRSIPVRFLALTAVCLLTAGCLSPREQLSQRDQDRCVARGYQPGTDAHADCLTGIESERQTRMESRRRDMMERSNIPPAATR